MFIVKHSEQLPTKDLFSVGEVVIVIPKLPGNYVIEATIQALPSPFDHIDSHGFLVDAGNYEVLLENGMEAQVTPDQLRKKRPPPSDRSVVSWDECPWQPQREIA